MARPKPKAEPQALARYAALVFLLDNGTLADLNVHCLASGEDAYDFVRDAVVEKLDEIERIGTVGEVTDYALAAAFAAGEPLA